MRVALANATKLRISAFSVNLMEIVMIITLVKIILVSSTRSMMVKNAPLVASVSPGFVKEAYAEMTRRMVRYAIRSSTVNL
jgi:hypothetical protein